MLQMLRKREKDVQCGAVTGTDICHRVNAKPNPKTNPNPNRNLALTLT